MEPYRKTNRILDSGCGLGWFLVEAKKRGWEAYGTEFSRAAVSICTEKGIKMTEGALASTMFEENFFDVITSFEVLEHINNPHVEMKAISRLLRRGGLFYCTTPNFNSAMRYYLGADYNVIEYPEHLSYYTRTTLNRLTAMHGLQNVKFLNTGISLTRLKRATGQATVQLPHAKRPDEILRNTIESRWYMIALKKFINSMFTLSNTGLTLKGYYEKPQA
jgi:2-polyprenyl-3-methyl-5-hydroxy-6-metoxy-1,4-benzoquinol methylase